MTTDVFKIIIGAVHPEDVFGAIKVDELKSVYRQLAKATHPDKHADDTVAAAAAFARLKKLHRMAEKKFEAGTYGDLSHGISSTIITSKLHMYSVIRLLDTGSLCDVYLAQTEAGDSVVLKIVRLPANSDLARNERQVLRFMYDTWEGRTLEAMAHVPKIIDAFQVKFGGVNREVNVFPYIEGMTLEVVFESFAAALTYVDPRSLAWMINRMLAAILMCHQSGYVHCGVTPDHVYVHPSTHGGQLLDWSYAVKAGEYPKAISRNCRSFYPPELINPDKSARMPATHGVDLYMLAKCVMFMTDHGARLPAPYAGIFRACLLGPRHRPQDAFEVFEDLQVVLKALYGPRKFIEFTLPSNNTKGK